MPKNPRKVSRSTNPPAGRSKPAKTSRTSSIRRSGTTPHQSVARRRAAQPTRSRSALARRRALAQAKEASLLRQDRAWKAPILHLPDPFAEGNRFGQLVVVISIGLTGWWVYCLVH